MNVLMALPFKEKADFSRDQNCDYLYAWLCHCFHVLFPELLAGVSALPCRNCWAQGSKREMCQPKSLTHLPDVLLWAVTLPSGVRGHPPRCP